VRTKTRSEATIIIASSLRSSLFAQRAVITLVANSLHHHQQQQQVLGALLVFFFASVFIKNGTLSRKTIKSSLKFNRIRKINSSRNGKNNGKNAAAIYAES